MNPNTQTREFSLRDPDGYYVTISALSAPQRRGPARWRPKKRLRPTKAAGSPAGRSVGPASADRQASTHASLRPDARL